MSLTIVCRNSEAVMLYQAFEWTSANPMQHGGGTGYLVAETWQNVYNILGTPDSIDGVTGEDIPGVPPMTEAEVQAIADDPAGFPIAT